MLADGISCLLDRPYCLLQNYSFFVMINHNSNIMLCVEDSNYSMTNNLAIKDPDCKI